MKTRDKFLIELILLFCAYNLEANEETLLKGTACQTVVEFLGR